MWPKSRINFGEFNVDALLDGDSKAQAEYFGKALGGPGTQGWMSVNERLVRMTEEEAQRFLSTDAVARAFVDAFTHAWRDRSRLRRELEPPAEEPAGNRLPDP